MEQLPKIVRQRLQASAKAGVHPEANLLAAYSEHSLNAGERAQVEEHLANCADCREVAALALPQVEMEVVAAAAAAKPPARRAWIFHPSVRWGALAACLVVVAGAVLWRYNTSRNKSVLVALQEPAPASIAQSSAQKDQESFAGNQMAAKEETNLPAATEARKALPPQPAIPALKQRVASRASDALEADKKIAEAPMEIQVVGGSAVAGDQLAKTKAPAMISTPAAKPESIFAARVGEMRRDEAKASHGPGIAVAGAAPAMQQESNVAVASEAAPPAPAPQKYGAVSGMSSATAAAQQAGSPVPRRNEKVLLQSAAITAVTPEWTLSSDGATLLRSLDSGRSWQIIPVGGGAVFRALAAVGPEIWLGGAHAALYHSSDAGQNWTQVRPSAGGRSLAADIIRVEAPDAQHCKLTTSDGQVWSTTDGGHSWEQK